MSTDLLLALYALGAHFHSGQGSRGYRISCRAQRALQRRNPSTDWLAVIEYLIDTDSPKRPEHRRAAVNKYWELVDVYGDSI